MEEVKKWTIDKFIRHLEALESIKAEENQTLQRMLDNHLWINSKDGIKIFSNIYKEFDEKIKREYKIEKTNKTSKQYIEEHEKRLRRLRGER